MTKNIHISFIYFLPCYFLICVYILSISTPYSLLPLNLKLAYRKVVQLDLGFPSFVFCFVFNPLWFLFLRHHK